MRAGLSGAQFLKLFSRSAEIVKAYLWRFQPGSGSAANSGENLDGFCAVTLAVAR